jgi:nucleotide-binding universal stress UspA family protein
MMPPTRVLAAVDFSDTSRTALSCAARLARHCEGELHIVHVPPLFLTASAFGLSTAFAAEIYDDLRAFVNATPCAALTHPKCHVVVGETARVIRDIATRERCDVIVLGAHGLAADDPSPLGPTTEQLLQEGDVPVLVVPIDWTPPDPVQTDLTGTGPVIAGLDFTCPSIDAASAGARLAARLHTRLLLVHAVPRAQVTPCWSEDVESIARQEAAIAHARVEPLITALRAIAPVDVRIEIGGIAASLAHAADGMPGALLVLGRAAHTQAYGVPGAIASRVLAHAHAPLLLATPSA